MIMTEYYAGTLNAKNKNLWQNKTECTDEAIREKFIKERTSD